MRSSLVAFVKVASVNHKSMNMNYYLCVEFVRCLYYKIEIVTKV